MSITGPVNPAVRWTKAIGSFRNTWWVMTGVTVLSILISLATVFILKAFPRYLLWFVLLICCIFCSLASIYFLTAIWTLIPNFPDTVLWFSLPQWKASNPIYGRMLHTEATITCIFIGLVFFGLAVGFGYKMTKVQDRMFMIYELMMCSYRAIGDMPTLWVWPVIESFIKLVITIWIWDNFVFLITNGFVDDRRIIVNEIQIQGASKKYYFNWWMLPWILYYAFGAQWALELVSSFGQFVNIYAICSWYYTAREALPPDYKTYSKEKDTRGLGQVVLQGLKNGFVWHLGTIIYGSSFMWFFRLPRILDYIFLDFDVPDATNPGQTGCCGKCGKCFCSFCSCCLGPLHQYIESAADENNIGLWNKNVYCDVVYRSTHWETALKRAKKVKDSHAQVKTYMHVGILPTFIGVIWVGCLGAGFAWSLFTQVGCFTDPSSSWYIQDPIACTILAWFIAANVGFGFFKVVEDGMDSLLYYYGVNKKHNKKTCNKYMPDELTSIVGNDHTNPDSYPYYGKNVPTTMYWMPYMSAFRPAGGAAAGKPADKKPPASSVRDMAPAAGNEPPPAGNQSYNQMYQSQSPYPPGPGQ